MILRFLLLYAGAVLSPGALSSAWSSECAGCHTEQRIHADGAFPNGFKKWTDANCYGCHAEITEVAEHHVAGIQDSRFLTLPISDARVKKIHERPLPYINSSLNPLESEGKNSRVNAETLLNFLQQPHGRCLESRCEAPTMMAYPHLGASSLATIDSLFGTDLKISETTVDIQAFSGEKLFETHCKACHVDSTISGYDAVGLSLFSSQWIQQYANGDSESDKRKMPKIPLDKNEAGALYAYFQSERQQRENLIETDLQNLLEQEYGAPQSKPALTDPVVEYLWKSFWRDAGCVHCHSIEGRAKEVFDTSPTGIKTWLKANNPQMLAKRLQIRHLEERHGIGASVPGMPMTGAPVPKPVINIIESWINAGCIDKDQNPHC